MFKIYVCMWTSWALCKCWLLMMIFLLSMDSKRARRTVKPYTFIIMRSFHSYKLLALTILDILLYRMIKWLKQVTRLSVIYYHYYHDGFLCSKCIFVVNKTSLWTNRKHVHSHQTRLWNVSCCADIFFPHYMFICSSVIQKRSINAHQ